MTTITKFLPLFLIVHFLPPPVICLANIDWRRLAHLVGINISPTSSVEQANAWIPAAYKSVLEMDPNGEILIHKPAHAHRDGVNFVFEFLSNLEHKLVLEIRLVDVKHVVESFVECGQQLQHAMGKDCAITAVVPRANKWVVDCGANHRTQPTGGGLSTYFLLEHRDVDRKHVVGLSPHTAATLGTTYARVHVKFLPEADLRPYHCTFALAFNTQENRAVYSINYQLLMARNEVPAKWRQEIFDPALVTLPPPIMPPKKTTKTTSTPTPTTTIPTPTTTTTTPTTTTMLTTPTTPPLPTTKDTTISTTTLTSGSPPISSPTTTTATTTMTDMPKKKTKTRYTMPPNHKHIAGFIPG